MEDDFDRTYFCERIMDMFDNDIKLEDVLFFMSALFHLTVRLIVKIAATEQCKISTGWENNTRNTLIRLMFGQGLWQTIPLVPPSLFKIMFQLWEMYILIQETRLKFQRLSMISTWWCTATLPTQYPAVPRRNISKLVDRGGEDR